MFGSFLNAFKGLADGPSADPSMCRVLPQLGWSRDPTSVASTIAFQSPKRTQSGGSEGAILVHHESGTMSAASDPGRDGGSAVRQRFLRDSAGRRDRGAPASRHSLRCCAVRKLEALQVVVVNVLESGRDAAGQLVVAQTQVPQISQAAQRCWYLTGQLIEVE